MTSHDPNLSRRPSKGLLGWLRGAGREEDMPQEDEARDTSVVLDPRRLARSQLLTDIADFLLAHDLEINPITLGVAHNYLTGGDGSITRSIDQRIQSRQALTLEWIELILRENGGDQSEFLNRLMNRLESNIEAFDRTSTAAKTAASEYGDALSAHVDGLEEMKPASAPADTGELVQELVSIARTMLERTASLEKDMARSMLETRALRRSLEQARRSAEEDHLTGLPNRRAFEHRFASEFASARDAGDQLAVAFCDIDNFKRINDEHGHEAGDRVLRNVASALTRISDDRCHVARHGGEEFVVLLRGRSLHQAWELLDDARAALAERRMVNRATDMPIGKVTFSAGIADVFSFADSRAALRAADRALYRAKAEGRNRVIVAEPTPEERARSKPAGK
ncbi:GGDEF domain-containing protein [Novosphingobium sp. SG707]|uniref:GGDEF domain-containing protein n=1 Tax=Novosphingobium sp. SG707 TaxID=2586996 RepID=UPI0014472859|nr:GGDEF domain-containing protein [Novosphingobium sp. SG707]NKI99263.1 diguanylate cyclase [Novosphingobium sp. SG707]